MVGAITYGKRYEVFKKVAVVSPVFQAQSDVEINFKGQRSLSMQLEGTGTVDYSFNGTDVSGDMASSKSSATLLFENRRVSAIWFRVTSGSPTIRVEAWMGVE